MKTFRTFFDSYMFLLLIKLCQIITIILAPTCNKNLTAATGTVSSPGFPNKYPNIKKCTTHIRVIPGKRVQLNFKKFSLEAHSQCSYDYLQIIDGSYMKKFCGQKVPSQYISNGNSVTLLFKSDSPVNDDGYMAE